MPVTALTSQRQTRKSVRAYVAVISKPIVIISVGYCVLSNISFQSSFDGALSMPRAFDAGLVTKGYAQNHAAEVVLFKRIGPRLFEYRVKHPLLRYAGIPWLIARRTNVDLATRCEGSTTDGCNEGLD